MLYFFKVRVEAKGISVDDLWNLWAKEIEAGLGPKPPVGKIVGLYKVSRQQSFLGIFDVEIRDELEQALMANLNIEDNLVFEKILPVVEYGRFTNDGRDNRK